MASSVYSKEQLNYFRICHIVTYVLPQGLRSIFKQEWDNRYRATFGEWKDTPQNGLDFYNGESPRSRTNNDRLLKTIKNGQTENWDCTTFFFPILYSAAIRHGLSVTVRSNVDDLREFRNEEFAHMPQGQLSDLQFRLAVRKVEIAFQCLGLSTVQIQNIRKQKSFPTEELQNVLGKVQRLYQELHVTNAKLQTLELQRQSLEEQNQVLEEQHRLLQEKQQVLEEQRQVLEEQLNSDVSSFCILPPKPSHEIATRGYEVAKITKQLEQLREANENCLSYLYISGNPGSGKSQLASLVAKKFYESTTKDVSAPSFVMTLNAESYKALFESYISLARQIKCPEYAVMCTLNSTKMQIVKKINNLKDMIAAKISLFASWLLVIDNVTSLSDIQHFLPQPGNERWKRGQLLITTQDTSSIPPESSFVSHISVSKGMVPTDACCFLAKISGIKDEEMENKVAKALDYQPLALASAGVYVKRIRGSKVYTNFGWKEYLEKLERGMRYLTEKELSKTNPSYGISMTAATSMAVERAINNQNNGSVAKSAFTFLSLCASQPLHLEIVMNYILNLEELLDQEEVAIQIQSLSLLMLEERENGVFISVHQVVHDVIRSLIVEFQEPHKYVQAVGVALTSFNQFIVTYLSQTWHDKDSVADSKHLIPHLEALAVEVENVFVTKEKYQVIRGGAWKNFDSISCFRRFGRLCENHYELFSAKFYFEAALNLVKQGNKTVRGAAAIYEGLGRVLQKMGQLQQAKQHHEHALDIQLKKLGPEHVDVARTHNNLGNVQLALGDLQQTKEHYERALDIQLKKLGPEHLHVADTYSNLGCVQLQLGDLQQTKKHYERALDIQLKNLGPEHVHVARTYNNLGYVQHALGDLQQAKENHKRALDIQLKKLGPEHVDVARAYISLGSEELELGDQQRAKEHCECALGILLEKLGPEHLEAALIYSNLGYVQYELRDLQQAKEHYERALDIQLKKLGPEHFRIARTYNNLGNMQYELGDLQQAKEHHERALDIQLKELGPEHVNVACTYNNLGNVQRALGDLQQAKEHHEHALDIQLKKLEPEHVDVARTYNNLGNVHCELGDLQQAKEHYERALGIRLKKLGPEHVDVARIYNNLGNVQSKLGDLQEAKEHYERALGIRLKKLGAEHVDVALTYNNLGNVQHESGNLQQAKEHYERALDIQLTKLGPEHYDVVRTYSNLGNVQYELGNLQQAKQQHERALDIQLTKLGPEHVDVACTYNNLGNVQFKLGDLLRAKEHYERALDIRLKNLGEEHADVAVTYSSLGRVQRELGDRIGGLGIVL